MGFEGRLDKVSFGDILNTLCNISKEGVLTIQDNKQKRIIHFRDNGITLIGGSQRVRLGDMVLQAGKIQDWELNNALAEQQKTGKMLGEILLEQGVISEEELEDLICDQIEQEICDIYFWENAYFSFKEGPPEESLLESESPITLMFDVQSVLLRIASQIGQWEEIRKDIPQLSTIFIVASEEAEISLPEGEKEENVQKVVEQLNGTHEITDIIRITGLPTLPVCRILSCLLKQGIIRTSSFEELIALAESCYEKGGVQRSLHFLEKALLIEPDNTDLLLKLAQRYESMGGKKAGEYYARLSSLSSDPKTALRYLESAVIHQPQVISHREKILELAEYLENKKKEIQHVKALIQLYQKEGNYEHAASLSEKYLETYPKDQELRHLLIEGYLAQDQVQRAIEEYQNAALALEQSGDLKLCIENLQKVLELAPRRDDVKKHIKRLRYVMKWSGKQNIVMAGVALGLLLLVCAGYAVFYEISARNLYESAQYLEKAKRLEIYHEIIQNYGYSSVAAQVQQEAAQLAQVLEPPQETATTPPVVPKTLDNPKEELVKILSEANRLAMSNRFDDAIAHLTQWESRYVQWPDLQLKITDKKQKIASMRPVKEDRPVVLIPVLDSISENCAQKNLNAAVEDYQTLQAIIKSSGKTEYQKYEQEKKSQIQWIAEQILEEGKNAAEKAFNDGIAIESVDFSLSASKYGEVLAEYKKVTDLILPADLKTDGSVSYLKRIESLKERAGERKQEIENCENRAQGKLKEIQRLEKEAERLEKESANAGEIAKSKKIEESRQLFCQAFEKALEIIQDPVLSKTSTGKEVLLPFRIETEPSGARIAGTDWVTPCTLPLKIDRTVPLTLTYRGFTPRKINLTYNNYLFEIDSEYQDVLNKGTIPEIVVNSLVQQEIALSPNAELKIESITSRWTIEDNGQKFAVVKDFKRGGKILNVYQVCDPISKFRLYKKELWAYDMERGIWGKIVPHRDKVFVTNLANKLVAINAEEGKRLWTFQSDRTGDMQASAAIYKDVVYVGSTDRYFYAVDIDDGSKKWEFLAEDFIAATPVVEQQGVIFTTRQGTVYSLEHKNKSAKKSALWQHDINEVVESSPVRYGKYILVGTKRGRLLALNIVNGEKLWEKKFEGGIVTTPVLAPPYVFVGTVKGEVFCIDMEKQEVAWSKTRLVGEIKGSLSVAPGYVYIGTNKGYFYKISTQNRGSEEWNVKFPDAVYAGAVSLDNNVYVPCMDGFLYLCDEATGKILWQQKYSNKGLRSDLIVDNNILYLATEEGILYALPGS